jgi:DNA-binding NtrC family response regulator
MGDSGIGMAHRFVPPSPTHASSITLGKKGEPSGLGLETGAPSERTPGAAVLPPLGRSLAIRKLLDTVIHVAPTEATVLFRGETGTGKGLLANLIHRFSSRPEEPFVEVVCGALPESLIESELFGHERGAFTGALEAMQGRFERAGSGTIFLDEVGDLGLQMQVKLLRVLQERRYERVGGGATRTTLARVVAATNRDLPTLIREGRFREDLFHRLNVVVLDVPPLRERRADIPVLARSFLAEFARKNRRAVPRMTLQAHSALLRHSWPGNVRDLRNCIERLVVLDRSGRIGVGDLPAEVRSAGENSASPRKAVCKEGERESLLRALHEAGGNRTAASELLGISRAQIYRLLRRYSL